MGDFTGITFCGLHSFTDLQITRVSNGSRYNEILIPNFQDVTATVPGKDGQYYWDAFYSNKTHALQIAFDGLDESHLRKLRQVFDAKKEGWLIYDECPYKKYWAKVQNPPQLNYICFDDPSTGARVYKGEGTINLVSYDPFARSVHKYLDEYSAASYPNKNEWSAASGMKSTQGSYDGGTGINLFTSIPVYNAGDVAADYKLYILTPTTTGSYKIELKKDNVSYGSLTITNVEKISQSDTYLCINSRTNLIEGYGGTTEWIPNNTVYNKFITAGDFFQIPVGGDYTFYFTKDSLANSFGWEVEYEYLYY